MNIFIIVFGFFAICMVGMAVGIILRNKGFSTCGRAAADAMEGGDGKCNVCGMTAGGACSRKKKA